jgi:hypothetical protein
VKEIDSNVFKKWYELGAMKFYFEGSKAEWKAMYVNTLWNSTYSSATVYFYSEQEPPRIEDQSRYDGLYWHYVEGVRTWWGWGE